MDRVLIAKPGVRTCSKPGKFRLRKKVGRNRFMKRVVNEWNKLTKNVVVSEIIESSKEGLNKYIDEEGRW